MAFVPDVAIDRLSELTKGARHLYVFLCRCRNQKTGRCYPSITTIMESLSINRGSVFALKRELIERGWATFDGNNATFLLGFNSLKNQTANEDSKADSLDMSAAESEKSDCPKNQTPDVANIEDSESLKIQTKQAESENSDSGVRKIRLDSLKIQTKQSEKSDLHIRKNQQIEPANRTSKEIHVESDDSTADRSPSENRAAEIKEIFAYWQKVLSHPTAKLTGERRRKIAGRLSDGYTVEQIKFAIDGCRASPYHQGENDRGTIYDDIELICRSGTKLENFMRYVEQKNGNGHRKRSDMLIDPATLSPKTRSNAAAAQAFIESMKATQEGSDDASGR